MATDLPSPQPSEAAQPRRILVACHDMAIAGGLFRFERVGAVLRRWGHELAFVTLGSDDPPRRPVDLPVLTLEQARRQRWDAVMLPGAGFPETSRGLLPQLRGAQFGVRVQHILNDQRRRAGFKAVNKAFAPHVVIFNNDAWPAGSFTEFKADAFHLLQGAVDSVRFRPRADRSHPLAAGRWIVGGLANKNPEPLVGLLEQAPPELCVRLFGVDRHDLAGRFPALLASGRLQLAGPLFGADLERFYDGVDCVAMTETGAGWANLGAEALACGVPLVCTRHGTTAFARDGETALLVEPPEPQALLAAILRLRGDPALCQTLAWQGRAAIAAFTWEDYGRRLLRLAAHDGRQHYLCAPELGLYGKWPLAQRLDGLDVLLQQAAGCSVIEFGAAEGVVGREFLRHGAAFVHGFEVDPQRVAAAAALCAAWPGTEFHAADLSEWDCFHAAARGVLRSSYDIVLYLGIQQHLPAATRGRTLRQAMRLAGRHFAYRSPPQVYAVDGVEEMLRAEGFALLAATEPADDSNAGPCLVFQRVAR